MKLLLHMEIVNSTITLTGTESAVHIWSSKHTSVDYQIIWQNSDRMDVA